MRTVDPAKHEAKRRRILDAATDCFARKGFERTTTADICAEAGISSGSLFHYFPTKRAVFLAIFEQDGREIAAQLAKAAEAEDAWSAVLELVETQAGQVTYPDVAGLVAEMTAHAGRDPEFAELLNRNDIALRDGLAGLLARAAEQGTVDASLDPVLAATWVSALIDTVFFRAAVDPSFDAGEQLAMLRLIVTRFLRAEP
ncbi:TetR/AcrR family transcriptional regulator [Amycolatopsis nigrescens]|uniref:TetR/AcrR family transcriptional regulator n=1 Tax=Amycolatopsis nigrescens TaxID=381445 RepID=UPI00037A79C4|nr:TetR/AcrR family transcriptional regulator [Amycolatopsis nigrescens]